MATVASKNPFDLLGNDIEDENDTPKPPMKEVVKKTTTSKKTDVAPAKAAAAAAPVPDSRGPRRPRGEGNEGAFRDRGAGRENNRSRPTDQQGGSGGGDRGGLRERGDRGDRGSRGGRGGRGGGGGGRGREYERHSGTGRLDTEKQVSQGWGNNKNELTEEQAGENIAQAEAADEAPVATAEGEQAEATEEAQPAADPEPEEDHTKSYAEYQAELESRAPVEELPEARRPNEGARDNKKWAAAKELVKEEGDEYFVGGKSKQKKAKSRNEKATVEINHEFVDPRSVRRGSADRGFRGSRGGPRGGGDRPARGGPGRGEYRGSRGGGQRGGSGGGLNVADEYAFPSLGK